LTQNPMRNLWCSLRSLYHKFRIGFWATELGVRHIMGFVDKENLNKLLELLNIRKKSDIEKYCRDFVVTSEGLSSLIMAGRINAIPTYLYDCQFKEFVPNHLPLLNDEINALGRNKVGQLEGKAKKAFSKVKQIFKDRKLFCAHIFYEPSFEFWHLFYFDQRDTDENNNHWKYGAHIHYSSNLISNDSLKVIWESVCLDRPKLPKSIHIKYDCHDNR